MPAPGCRLTKTTSGRARSPSVWISLGLPLATMRPCTRFTKPTRTTCTPWGASRRRIGPTLKSPVSSSKRWVPARCVSCCSSASRPGRLPTGLAVIVSSGCSACRKSPSRASDRSWLPAIRIVRCAGPGSVPGRSVHAVGNLLLHTKLPAHAGKTRIEFRPGSDHDGIAPPRLGGQKWRVSFVLGAQRGVCRHRPHAPEFDCVGVLEFQHRQREQKLGQRPAVTLGVSAELRHPLQHGHRQGRHPDLARRKVVEMRLQVHGSAPGSGGGRNSCPAGDGRNLERS